MVEEEGEHQRLLEENIELRKALEHVKDRLLKMNGGRGC